MRPFRKIRVLGILAVLGLAGWLCLAALVPAAPGQTGEQTPPPRTLAAFAPLPNPIGIDLPGHNRTIFIHQAAQSEGRFVGVSAHRPLFALVKRPAPPKGQPDPLKGEPDIVHDLIPREGGITRLEFKMVLTSPTLQKVCEAEARLRAKPGEVVRQVVPWPIQLAVVDVLHGDDVLGSGKTDSLKTVSTVVGVMEFAVAMTAEDLQRFRSGLASGKVRFRVAHAYDNVQEVSGTAKVTADKTTARNVKETIDACLTAEQRQGKALTFQTHLNDLDAVTKLRVHKEIRLGHEKLYALLGESSSLVGKAFELDREIPWEQIAGSPELREQTARALAPLVQRTLVSRSREDLDKQETEKSDSTTFGAGFSLAGFGANGNTTSAQRELFARQTGITWRCDREKQQYMPAHIKVFHLKSGWQNLVMESTEMAYLALGSSNSLFEETPVKCTFTADAAAELLAEADRQLGRELQAKTKHRADLEAACKEYEAALAERNRLQVVVAKAQADHSEADRKYTEAAARHSQAAQTRATAIKAWEDEIEQARKFVRGELPGPKPPPNVVEAARRRNPSIEELVSWTDQSLQDAKNKAVAAEAAAAVAKNSAATERDQKLAALKPLEEQLFFAEGTIRETADKKRKVESSPAP